MPVKRRGDFAEEGEAAFDWRKLLGLSFMAFLLLSAWAAFRIGSKRRDERVAVIEP